MKKYILFIISFILIPLSVNAEDVAEINGKGYTKISSAINAAPNETKTTIKLLKDWSENITIGEKKDIVLDLNNYTLSNNGNYNTIVNNGKLEIMNGTVTTTADSKGMIDNNSKGTLTLLSGNYIANGGRQAVYNNAGTTYISGNVYIEGNAAERATIHNLNGGTIYITNGTIISNNLYAIYNEKGTIDIGTKNDVCDKTIPVIQGKTYGIVSNNKYSYNVYDGIIKGGIYHFGKTSNTGNTPTVVDDVDETRVADIEEDSEKVLSEEVIAGVTYKTFNYYIDETKIKITFDPNGGTVSPNKKRISIGDEIGELPEPVKVDYSFDGWFTAISEGIKVTTSTKPSTNTTFFAHWTYVDPNTVAYVEGVGPMSLKDAFLHGGNIRLEKDVIISEDLLMNAEANLDLNGHKINMLNNCIQIIEKVTIDDSSDGKKGKITSTDGFTIIVGSSQNQNNGYLIHKGGTIEGLGEYGAIANKETTVIDGGTVEGTATGNRGFVVYNYKELIMKSGTIHSTNGRAVQVHTNSTFQMDGGLLKSDAENDQTLNLYGDCEATINGGTIEGLSYNTAGIAMFANTNLTINGGTIKGYSMAVAGNGSDQNANANITVNGGDLIATNGIGMYLPQQNSTTIINGGNISGQTGIEIRASKLVVNGGNITATTDNYSYQHNANGSTTKGAAIAVSQHNTKKPIEVIINNGNIEGAVPLCNVNPMNNPIEYLNTIRIEVNNGNFTSNTSTVIALDDTVPNNTFINGGTFNVNPIQHVNDGYSVQALSNSYVVVKAYNLSIDSSSINLVQIDKNKYSSNEEVVLKNVQNKGDYATVIELYDTNGNKLNINIIDNKFRMPEKDVIIKVSYEPIGSVLGARRVLDVATSSEMNNNKNNKIKNPITNDNIKTYIILSVISILGIVVLIKKIKKA